MDLEQLLKAMTPEVYQNLKTAVEIGKWADGTPLNESQKESTIQAIMIYDATHHADSDEPFRVQSDGSVRLGKAATVEQVQDLAVRNQDIIVKSKPN